MANTSTPEHVQARLREIEAQIREHFMLACAWDHRTIQEVDPVEPNFTPKNPYAAGYRLSLKRYHEYRKRWDV